MLNMKQYLIDEWILKYMNMRSDIEDRRDTWDKAKSMLQIEEIEE